MKNYLEVISEARERYPSAVDDTSCLRKIYNRERELFRTIFRKKTTTELDLLAGQYLYPLDFHISKIIHVVVDGKKMEYEEINNQSTLSRSFIYTRENSLGIYPTPEKDVERGIMIFRYFEPIEPSSTSDEISFDKDFAMILVYGLCIDFAEIDNDAAMVNNFTSKYNGLIDELLNTRPEPFNIAYIKEHY